MSKSNVDGNGERDMPTIVHFEIPSDDIERSRNFYNDLFGWKFEKWTGSLPLCQKEWSIG